MVQKTALFIASLAASVTLAVALAAAGFAPGAPAVPADAAPAVSTDAASASQAPAVQIDKVYVPAPVPQKTITVHKVLQTAGGENESEASEGGD
jgi:hypothetical protein